MLAMVPLGLIVLAGCGGGGGGSGDSTSMKTSAGLSRAEYIRRGDDLCRAFRKTSAPLNKQIDQTNDPAEQARLLQEGADALDKTLQGFDELPKPNGDEKVLTDYLDLGRTNVVLVRRAADALDAGKAQEATTLLQSGVAASNRARGIAQSYGFKVCGSG